jgi:hypothetical protein
MYVLATMAYELSPQTEPDAVKLLRAELAGRRWLDRHEGERMPAHTVWMKRTIEPGQTTDDVQALAGAELRKAVAAVAATGRRIGLVRAFVQVTGAGSLGLVPISG